jgi:hypothetical protein
VGEGGWLGRPAYIAGLQDARLGRRLADCGGECSAGAYPSKNSHQAGSTLAGSRRNCSWISSTIHSFGPKAASLVSSVGTGDPLACPGCSTDSRRLPWGTLLAKRRLAYSVFGIRWAADRPCGPMTVDPVHEGRAMEQELALDGRIALVTGGSRGIGLAAAQGLGLAGATVVIVGRDRYRAEEAAADLLDEGIDAVGHGCDVADPAAVARLVQDLGPLSGVDVLVASAGVMSARMAKTLRTSAEEWRRVMSVNLDGAFHAIAAFAPGMAERRRGRIITVSACLGRFTGPGTSGGLAPYRVSKAAAECADAQPGC